MSLGLAGVSARVAALQAQLGALAPTPVVVRLPARPADAASPVPSAGSTGVVATGGTFAAALGQANAHLAASSMPVSATPGGLARLTTTALSGAAATAGGDGAAAGVVAAAQRYLGVPYRWGGTDPATGLDCSGFVQRVYADVGIRLPRVSNAQAQAGSPVAGLDQARPGDLIAFGSPVDHIGIYLGNGQMVAAPHTGDVVRVQPVYRTPSAIRRILPDPVPGAAAVAPGGLTAGRAATSGAGSDAAYAALFQAAETRYALPTGLLSAVARVESGYDPTAVSRAGAVGLMQLMPATARGLGVDPRDPAQAVEGAARLLADNLRQFGSVPLALAAYNAGPGAVARYGGIPPYAETTSYVQRVVGLLGGS